jgi:hypothetical protein
MRPEMPVRDQKYKLQLCDNGAVWVTLTIASPSGSSGPQPSVTPQVKMSFADWTASLVAQIFTNQKP